VTARLNFFPIRRFANRALGLALAAGIALAAPLATTSLYAQDAGIPGKPGAPATGFADLAERRQRIVDRVHHARQTADGAAFARSLDAQGIGLGRHRMAAGFEIAEIVGARHGVIHERA